MRQSSKNTKAKNLNSKSFINCRGRLSGKNLVRKMTKEEIEHFPLLIAYYYLSFEDIDLKNSRVTKA